jgi:hypothetical protein
LINSLRPSAATGRGAQPLFRFFILCLRALLVRFIFLSFPPFPPCIILDCANALNGCVCVVRWFYCGAFFQGVAAK